MWYEEEVEETIHKKNKYWHSIKHKAYVNARLMWPMVDYKEVDMLLGYMIAAETIVKTNHLLQVIIDEKNLGGYEEIGVTN